MNCDENKISLLDDTPNLSNKMEFHETFNGNWLLRVRMNPCHLFHGNDRINLGFKRVELDNVEMRISVKIKGKTNTKMTACANHSNKFSSKVITIIINMNL